MSGEGLLRAAIGPTLPSPLMARQGGCWERSNVSTPAPSRSISPLTIMVVTVSPGTPACSWSVPEGRTITRTA